ncbi:MAG: TraB/GumN family protein [Alphaproteobacteria bacterium]
MIRNSFALVAMAALFLAGTFVPASAQTACSGNNLLDQLARDDPARHAAVLAEVDAIENSVGNFWKIEKPGLPPSFLFGTAHISDIRALNFLDAIGSDLQSSRILLVELDSSQQTPLIMAAALAKYAQLPDGETLELRLTDSQRGRLADETARHGIPWFQARKYRAGFLATVLSIPPCAKLALLQGEKVLDMRIAELAGNANVTVRGLETADEQFAALARLDEQDMLDAIVESLDLDDQFTVDLYETTVALYARERISILDGLIDALSDDLPENQVAADQMKTVLVVPRNRTMVARAKPELARGGAFIAVGALHLPGNQGLVALVRRAGFDVSRLDLHP